MKRRLWIAGLSLFILAASKPKPAQASSRSGCIHYECVNQNGCDIDCSCRYVGDEGNGECQ
jgi:hypothetical protein